MTITAATRKSTCRVTDCGNPTDLYLCGPDTADVEQALAEVPWLFEQLEITATRQARVYRTSRRAAVEPEQWRNGDSALVAHPLPVDLAASELRDQLTNTLTTWARHIAENRGTTITGAPAAFLLRNINSIRLDEAAGELHRELTTVTSRARRAIDRSPSRVFAGPCHAMVDDVVTEDRDGTVWTHTVRRRCERDLYAPGRVFDADWLARKITDGHDVTITCDGWSPDGLRDGCGTVHEVTERDRWLEASLDGALVPLVPLRAFAQRVLKLTWPPASTVRSWMYRGQLLAQGVDRSGVELFDATKVLELVRDDAARPGRKTRRSA